MQQRNMIESLPKLVLDQLTDLDREVIRLVCEWSTGDFAISLEKQGRTIHEAVRPSICRNLNDGTYFIKLEQREWSAYSKTNWWRGRPFRNSYEHPLKVLADMLVEAFLNAVDPDETTEFTGGV